MSCPIIGKWTKNYIGQPKKDQTVQKTVHDSENNKPNETFMVYQCTLKRTSIATFKEATEISDVMRLQYDTDEKSIDESATKKVSKRKGPVQKENLGKTPDWSKNIDKVSISELRKIYIFLYIVHVLIHYCTFYFS